MLPLALKFCTVRLLPVILPVALISVAATGPYIVALSATMLLVVNIPFG